MGFWKDLYEVARVVFFGAARVPTALDELIEKDPAQARESIRLLADFMHGDELKKDPFTDLLPLNMLPSYRAFRERFPDVAAQEEKLFNGYALSGPYKPNAAAFHAQLSSYAWHAVYSTYFDMIGMSCFPENFHPTIASALKKHEKTIRSQVEQDVKKNWYAVRLFDGAAVIEDKSAWDRSHLLPVLRNAFADVKIATLLAHQDDFFNLFGKESVLAHPLARRVYQHPEVYANKYASYPPFEHYVPAAVVDRIFNLSPGGRQ